jgi:hypothetical protein
MLIHFNPLIQEITQHPPPTSKTTQTSQEEETHGPHHKLNAVDGQGPLRKLQVICLMLLFSQLQCI